MTYYVHWDFGPHHEHECGMWAFRTLAEAQSAARDWEAEARRQGEPTADVIIIKGEGMPLDGPEAKK